MDKDTNDLHLKLSDAVYRSNGGQRLGGRGDWSNRSSDHYVESGM